MSIWVRCRLQGSRDVARPPMPELPEVETVCWRLHNGGHGELPLRGRSIDIVDAVDPRAVVEGNIGALLSRPVQRVWRRAKWIVVSFAEAPSLVIHLKMTGDVHVVPPAAAPRYVRLRAILDDGSQLVFTDPRRFGHLHVIDDPQELFVGLGPEPLDPTFTPAVLRARLGASSRSIKAALIDLSIVAGIGNIYADEACFDAQLHPATPAHALSDDEISRLLASIKRVLLQSIAQSKIELSWRYENRSTDSPFQVYDRAGMACIRCASSSTASPLQSTRLASRTTVFCPRCQPHPQASPA
jgi:formamidopyrimidine-DNA glycosylase